MSEDELLELEYLRAWSEDLDEEQFNRLKQLESKASKVIVAKRGADAKQAMDKEIRDVRKDIIKKDSPTWSALLPYTRDKMVESGDDAGFMQGMQDVGSLPGRFAYQAFDPTSGIGTTSEELAEQGKLGGAIMTDPFVGWSIPLAPVGAAAGGATALGLGATRAIPLAEIAGSATASTVAAPFLRDNYGVSDLGVDAATGLLGGALGTGLAKIPKSAAFARMRKVLSREGVNDVSDEALEQVYTNLGRPGGGGTAKTAERAAEKTTGKIASNLEPQYSGPNADARETARELILQPGAFDNVITQLEKRSMLNPSNPQYIKESTAKGYKSRLVSAKKSYEDIVERAYLGKDGQFFDPQAWQAAVGDVLSDVKDIPGAVDMLAGGLAKGSQLRDYYSLQSLLGMPDAKGFPGSVVNPGSVSPFQAEAASDMVRQAEVARQGLVRDAGALNAQGQLARLYTPPAIQLNLLGLGKAMVADVPSAARSTDAAVRALTMGAVRAKKEKDLPYQVRLKDFYKTGEQE